MLLPESGQAKKCHYLQLTITLREQGTKSHPAGKKRTEKTTSMHILLRGSSQGRSSLSCTNLVVQSTQVHMPMSLPVTRSADDTLHETQKQKRMLVIPSNDIHQKVKDVCLFNRFSDVFLLQRPTLVQLRVVPGTNRQIKDEQFARFGKEHGCLCRDHADVFVRFHDPLDSCKWQVVVRFEVLFGLVRVRLHHMQLFLPKRLQRTVQLSQKLRRIRRGRWRLRQNAAAYAVWRR
mmetsp:Transcript_8332/g.23988  ORF Transcript_8332/g.23988 Transcript_8332/m.23988 type:complete len:234 (+) Transcript_8332:71-772(+)